jgi:ketosteroid isomerase-like protein
MEHPNATRQREVNEAFKRGDLDAVRNYWADDLVWHQAGTGPLAGTYRGWDEFMTFLQRFYEMSGGTFNDEIIDVLADDRHAVTVFSLDVGRQRDAERFHTTFTYAAKLDAEGKQTEGWFIASDQRAWDEFWS